MNKVERLYKKYFNKPVAYTENWKYELISKLENKKSKYFIPSLAGIISILIIITTMFYTSYKNNEKINNIKTLLLSNDAINFVIYNNIGRIVEEYYLFEDNYTDANREELKNEIKDSLILYYYITLKNKKYNKLEELPEIIDDTSEEIVKYLNNNFKEIIL